MRKLCSSIIYVLRTDLTIVSIWASLLVSLIAYHCNQIETAWNGNSFSLPTQVVTEDQHRPAKHVLNITLELLPKCVKIKSFRENMHAIRLLSLMLDWVSKIFNETLTLTQREQLFKDQGVILVFITHHQETEVSRALMVSSVSKT